MFQRDYILRMIEQFAKVISKVLFNKETENYDSALSEIQNNYAGIFGIDKELIVISSAEEIIALLKLRGKDEPKVFIMLAEFLKEETDLQKTMGGFPQEKIVNNYHKSLSLYFEAVLYNKEYQTKGNFEKIDSLIKEMEGHPRFAGLVIKTIHYCELKGDYANAENILFELINSNPLEAAAEGEDFYNRLKSKSDEELLKGNFSRGEIEQGLSEFKERIKRFC